jgi:hypothetical protein
MKKIRLGGLASASILFSSVLLGGCVADLGTGGESAADQAPADTDPAGLPALAGASSVHLMPLQLPESASPRRTATAAAPRLHYYGGPVISNVAVYTVFWGGVAQVNYAYSINGFYAGVTQSAYFDWLTEYNTSAQTIGRGSFIGSFDDVNAPTGTVDDTQIQSRLGSLIGAGSVPEPTANTLYAIHMAPGITVTEGGAQSCSYFCAYHGTFARNGVYVYYSVIPDQGGGCAGGCGGDASRFNNTTSVASHELVEAVTDAAIGSATATGAPLAWYDATYGEIGDICNARQGRVVGGNGYTYVVQQEFSNRANACIVSGGSAQSRR